MKMKLKCKKCGGHLSHEDTMDTYGGLEDDYYVERQAYSCDECGTDYTIEKRVDIKPEEVEIIYFEEA